MTLSNFENLDYKKVKKQKLTYKLVESYEKLEPLSYTVASRKMKIETKIGKEVETKNTAHRGDFLICGPKGEIYVVPFFKVVKLYNIRNSNLVSRPVHRYAAVYNGPRVEFDSPWNEKMIANKGDYIIKDGEKFYRIEKTIFKETYEYVRKKNRKQRGGKGYKVDQPGERAGFKLQYRTEVKAVKENKTKQRGGKGYKQRGGGEIKPGWYAVDQEQYFVLDADAENIFRLGLNKLNNKQYYDISIPQHTEILKLANDNKLVKLGNVHEMLAKALRTLQGDNLPFSIGNWVANDNWVPNDHNMSSLFFMAMKWGVHKNLNFNKISDKVKKKYPTITHPEFNPNLFTDIMMIHIFAYDQSKTLYMSGEDFHVVKNRILNHMKTLCSSATAAAAKSAAKSAGSSVWQ